MAITFRARRVAELGRSWAGNLGDHPPSLAKELGLRSTLPGHPNSQDVRRPQDQQPRARRPQGGQSTRLGSTGGPAGGRKVVGDGGELTLVERIDPGPAAPGQADLRGKPCAHACSSYHEVGVIGSGMGFLRRVGWPSGPGSSEQGLGRADPVAGRARVAHGGHGAVLTGLTTCAALPQLLHPRLGHRHRRRHLDPRRVSQAGR